VLNKHYGGVIKCLNELMNEKYYPGVYRVDILPIEGIIPDACSIEKHDELKSNLLLYLNNINI
jgi:hypothetical protein